MAQIAALWFAVVIIGFIEGYVLLPFGLAAYCAEVVALAGDAMGVGLQSRFRFGLFPVQSLRQMKNAKLQNKGTPSPRGQEVKDKPRAGVHAAHPSISD